MDFQRKVEIDELEELEHKQESDLDHALGMEDDPAPVDAMLWAIEDAPAEPVHVPDPNAKLAWVDSLELAQHYTEETLGQELVKHVHDLMADDVAALVHEHGRELANDDVQEQAWIPDFFADSDRASGGTDDRVADSDDWMVVTSAHRPDDLDGGWNEGNGGPPGGGSGGGAPSEPPPSEPPPDPTKPAGAAASPATKPESPGPASPKPANPQRSGAKKE